MYLLRTKQPIGTLLQSMFFKDGVERYFFLVGIGKETFDDE